MSFIASQAAFPKFVLLCSGGAEPVNAVPDRSQFEPDGQMGTLVGHMSAVPEYLRRFFSDALAVVIPLNRCAFVVFADPFSPFAGLERAAKGMSGLCGTFCLGSLLVCGIVCVPLAGYR